MAGKDHAKWNPCATAFFQFQPDIRINQALMDTLTFQEKEEWVNAWPSKAVKLTPDGEVRQASRYECDNPGSVPTWSPLALDIKG